jgi:hypothetical protein
LQEPSASDPDVFDRQLDYFFDDGRNTALAVHAADMVIAMFHDLFFGLSPNHEFTFRARIPASELFIFSYPGHRPPLCPDKKNWKAHPSNTSLKRLMSRKKRPNALFRPTSALFWLADAHSAIDPAFFAGGSFA